MRLLRLKSRDVGRQEGLLCAGKSGSFLGDGFSGRLEPVGVAGDRGEVPVARAAVRHACLTSRGS